MNCAKCPVQKENNLIFFISINKSVYLIFFFNHSRQQLKHHHGVCLNDHIILRANNIRYKERSDQSKSLKQRGIELLSNENNTFAKIMGYTNGKPQHKSLHTDGMVNTITMRIKKKKQNKKSNYKQQ